MKNLTVIDRIVKLGFQCTAVFCIVMASNPSAMDTDVYTEGSVTSPASKDMDLETDSHAKSKFGVGTPCLDQGKHAASSAPRSEEAMDLCNDEHKLELAPELVAREKIGDDSVVEYMEAVSPRVSTSEVLSSEANKDAAGPTLPVDEPLLLSGAGVQNDKQLEVNERSGDEQTAAASVLPSMESAPSVDNSHACSMEVKTVTVEERQFPPMAENGRSVVSHGEDDTKKVVDVFSEGEFKASDGHEESTQHENDTNVLQMLDVEDVDSCLGDATITATDKADETQFGEQAALLHSDGNSADVDVDLSSSQLSDVGETDDDSVHIICCGCTYNVGSANNKDEPATLPVEGGKKKSSSVRCLKKTDSNNRAAAELEEAEHEQLAWDKEPLLGFSFNENGELRDKKGNRFVFEVSHNHRRNQERYERLGEAITEEIYKQLEARCKLQRIYLPLGVENVEQQDCQQLPRGDSAGLCVEGEGTDATAVDQRCSIDLMDNVKTTVADPSNKHTVQPSDATDPTSHVACSSVETCPTLSAVTVTLKPPNKPHNFIFVSSDWATADRLLILIHGSGVVRAGQWARRLIINDDLEKGTQIPYINRAISEGYGVIVLNGNRNMYPDDSKDNIAEPIPESEDPESHALYVWRELIMKRAKAQHVAIVAHSYGGMVTLNLVAKELEDCQRRLFAVAFTDSVHGFSYMSFSNRFSGPEHLVKVREFFAERACNWVTSDRPVDEPMPGYQREIDAVRVSAGHSKHEWTSWASFESVFTFLNRRLDQHSEEPSIKKQEEKTEAVATVAQMDQLPNQSVEDVDAAAVAADDAVTTAAAADIANGQPPSSPVP